MFELLKIIHWILFFKKTGTLLWRGRKLTETRINNIVILFSLGVIIYNNPKLDAYRDQNVRVQLNGDLIGNSTISKEVNQRFSMNEMKWLALQKLTHILERKSINFIMANQHKSRYFDSVIKHPEFQTDLLRLKQRQCECSDNGVCWRSGRRWAQLRTVGVINSDIIKNTDSRKTEGYCGHISQIITIIRNSVSTLDSGHTEQQLVNSNKVADQSDRTIQE